MKPREVRARAARSEQATKAYATPRAVIAEIQRTGAATLKAIAQELEPGTTGAVMAAWN
jgi:hypothetical protein